MQLSSSSQLVQSSPTHSPVEPPVAVVSVADPGPPPELPSASVVASLSAVVAGAVEGVVAVLPVVPDPEVSSSPEGLHAASNTHTTPECFTVRWSHGTDRRGRCGIVVSRVACRDIGAGGAWMGRRGAVGRDYTRRCPARLAL